MTGKIRGLPQTPGKTKIRGSFTSYYSPAFQRWVIRRWPSGNGATSVKRALMNERFKTATQVIKDADPLMWQAAEEWAKNSPYLARDVLMASAMGTFLTVNMQDGTTKVSYSMTNVTIQQYLDSLSNAVGGVIVRTADGWVVLLPGAPNQVLTMNAETALPDWEDAQGGGGGGGYPKGDPPSVVQFAYAQSVSNAATFATPPTAGSLLIAHCFNPLTQTAAAGWTRQTSNSTGTDYGVILTRVAGASEPAAQTVLNGAGTTGAVMMWELSSTTGTPIYLSGATQAEVTGQGNSMPVIQPITKDAICLSSVAVVTGQTITASHNIGVLDILSNTGTRNIAAGHADLGDIGNGGLYVTLSAAANNKAASCLVGSP